MGGAPGRRGGEARATPHPGPPFLRAPEPEAAGVEEVERRARGCCLLYQRAGVRFSSPSRPIRWTAVAASPICSARTGCWTCPTSWRCTFAYGASGKGSLAGGRPGPGGAGAQVTSIEVSRRPEKGVWR